VRLQRPRQRRFGTRASNVASCRRK
jgi:hypothetical protein